MRLQRLGPILRLKQHSHVSPNAALGTALRQPALQGTHNTLASSIVVVVVSYQATKLLCTRGICGAVYSTLVKATKQLERNLAGNWCLKVQPIKTQVHQIESGREGIHVRHAMPRCGCGCHIVELLDDVREAPALRWAARVLLLH